MDQRRLGGSDIEVSRIILGCGNFGGIGSAPAYIGLKVFVERTIRSRVSGPFAWSHSPM